jgi:hypothetical protein
MGDAEAVTEVPKADVLQLQDVSLVGPARLDLDRLLPT